MDSAPTRGRKNSPNNASIVFNLSKLCKLNAVSVVSSIEKPKPTSDSQPASSEEVSGSDDSHDCKVHPRPLRKSSSTSCGSSEEDVILRLFNAISALKCAYVRLQQAHIPYDPEKIEIADGLIVSELETLSGIEEFYMSHTSLSLEIQEYQELLDFYQSKLRIKESEIERLKWEIGEMDRKNEELQEKISKHAPLPLENQLPLSRGLTAERIFEVYKSASKSIHDFAKPLISLMKASEWDLDQSVSSIDSSTIFTERSHKKYAFEAYLSRKMFDDYTEEDLVWCQFDRVMIYHEPFDSLVADPDSGFAKFCRSMYVSVISSEMESSFFGHLDNRKFVLGGGHPRTPFYQSFSKMARWVWALRVMVNSIEPKAEIFYARRGDMYCVDIMENVVDQTTTPSDEFKVGFTVTPGYIIGNSTIRCRIYLCKLKSSANRS